MMRLLHHIGMVFHLLLWLPNLKNFGGSNFDGCGGQIFTEMGVNFLHKGGSTLHETGVKFLQNGGQFFTKGGQFLTKIKRKLLISNGIFGL